MLGWLTVLQHLKPIAHSMLTASISWICLHGESVGWPYEALQQSEVCAVSCQLHSSHLHDTLVGMGRSWGGHLWLRDTSLVWGDHLKMASILAAEEALSNLAHRVVAFHHLQQDTLPRKLLGLEHVLAAVTALCLCLNHKYPAPLLQQLQWYESCQLFQLQVITIIIKSLNSLSYIKSSHI